MSRNLSDYFPEVHTQLPNGEEVQALLDEFQDRLDVTLNKIDQLVELKNPNKFPIEDFRIGFEEFVNFNVPQIRNQTNDDIRRQLARRFDWVSIKGTATSAIAYLNSINFLAETEIMVSDDYVSFVPITDQMPALGNYFITPHVEVRLSPQTGINGQFFTQEIWNIISTRLDQVYPLKMVPHHVLEVTAFAEDFHNVLNRGGVEGVTLDKYQINDAVEVGKCQEVEDNDVLEVKRDYEHSYAEFISKAEVGTLSSSPTSSTSNLDDVFYTVNTMNGEWKPTAGQYGYYEVTFDLFNASHTDKDINAVLFYDDVDQPVACFKFPTVNLFTENFLEWNFVARFIRSPHQRIRAKFDEQQGNGELDGVYTWTTSNYNLSFNGDVTLDNSFRLDRGLKLDETGKVPYLATINKPRKQDQKGSWRAGNLDGYSGDLDSEALQSGDIWNPLSERCHDFELYFDKGLKQMVFKADLVKSNYFDEEIEQIGIYDQNDDLIIHSQFDPVKVDGQSDRVEYVLKMNIDANI